MRDLGGLASAASFFGSLVAQIDRSTHAALDEAATIVQSEAKRVIGTYDYGWPPLKPATVARKANGDTPLLETGEMRESIEKTVGQREAAVGSNSDKAVWHELGTPTIPARSFLAGAAVHNEAEVRRILGKRVVASIAGTKVF